MNLNGLFVTAKLALLLPRILDGEKHAKTCKKGYNFTSQSWDSKVMGG